MAGRLRRVVNWTQVAPFVKKLEVKFDPVDARAKGLREVYRLASGPKVREANPQYEVDIVLDEKCCDPVATLTYVDGTPQSLEAADKHAGDLLVECWEVCYPLQVEQLKAGSKGKKK